VTEIAVQINGKLRATVSIPTDAPQEEAFAAALADEKIAELTAGKTFVKKIYVPKRLVNFVVK
jgi:leucyl-tRNA synthetase